jgi:hypothetical protein
MRYRTKYGNIRVRHDGKWFDSKKEARRYKELCLLEAAGKISQLMIHPKYTLQASFRDRGGRAVRAINCTWDFSYVEGDRIVVEDVKSPATREEAAYNIRRRMFIKRFPDIEFREV